MIIPRPEEAIHKTWLYRLLTALLDQPLLAQNLYFKGGTAAAMLGWLDRFSVDLDFDLREPELKKKLRPQLKPLFKRLGLKIKDESQVALQFILQYEAPPNRRSTLKLAIIDTTIKANDYAPFYLAEIDRTANCQTAPTMFANKLVALVERHEKTGSIAGRDLYDLHHFFGQGQRYKPEIIEERRQTPVDDYLRFLIDFIQKQVTTTIIDQDLNFLLPPEKFQTIRRTLKTELLVYLQDELKRLG